eukprot:CAMPEP_0114502210 /NCGR_PEP_ID=MMETSP0109-20121206/8938_1 /TAXON_ID=29199 /ORGANISM="Chlorarachnion reptans, Strain CCCM449" /LENGTH=158 /DNA_ID=CAMNT_0001680047 /DNA_START=268 /DNA_END=744 /DNA_ORIENTATION=+
MNKLHSSQDIQRWTNGCGENKNTQKDPKRREARFESKITWRKHTLRLLNGDFLKSERWWEDADVVYATCTCYGVDLMKKIQSRADYMKVGSFFLSLSKPLQSPFWKVIGADEYRYSFGVAKLYTQVRIPNVAQAVPTPILDESCSSDEEEECKVGDDS